jgi:hypothetical protein
MTLAIVLAGLRRIYPQNEHGQIAAAVKLSHKGQISAIGQDRFLSLIMR